MSTTTCQISALHCEQCGRETFGTGYSECCNQLVVTDLHGCRNHHGEQAEIQRQIDTAVTAHGFTTRNEMGEAIGWDAFDKIADQVIDEVVARFRR